MDSFTAPPALVAISPVTAETAADPFSACRWGLLRRHGRTDKALGISMLGQTANPQLSKTGHSAQNAGQAASSAKNLAKERIVFCLSSLKPRSSSSLTRVSYKSLPNTCVRCEYR